MTHDPVEVGRGRFEGQVVIFMAMGTANLIEVLAFSLLGRKSGARVTGNDCRNRKGQ
jgi:hypothetical protein